MTDDAPVTTAASPVTSSGPAAGATREGRPAAGPSAGGRRAKRSQRRKYLEIAFFVTPALAMLLLFVVWPVITAVQMSVFRWNGRGPLVDFVGLANYVSILGNDVFVGSLVNNLIIVVTSIAIQLPLGLAIALLLNRKMWGQGALRTIIFVPYVLAEVVAGVIWFQLVQPQYGVIDTILLAVGIEPPAQGWLGDMDLALWTVVAILTWKYLGLAVILFLAGLQGVPEELYEAAQLDGASWWQVQRRITIPLLGPTIRTWGFLSMIGSLQLFDMVWILTKGGPANATSTMAVFLVNEGTRSNNFGIAGAASVILFLIALVMAVLYQRLILRRDAKGVA
ncbi:carbohydrate ABC transporter membrane protein 1 (CUT1 family) [Isoptericola sp. CG 20/1183]|uniref:Carbohydrate ABC transporter membrane protein 1 (CUT1 family) n=1 Tax=Isoptericola halotolerans TaxID=300560 RepID=A0ABX5E9Q5_9MICO|nr:MULTISPECIES: sugar ABC transporter permease [Isoptericola]MCK0116535.1 sugar ABC transporter permease [Isoptericola sp. S6320L]PRZ03081.1 carbohydrate ABC transporter membrane protein 1 (CUT1 family) [Isoptericola sp. CG 20/1183]PRZ03335.1 carbohydrate ABC transporter membrane protein 1 (CUT1 family) [Isoptericola halotolerans]